MIQNIYTVFDSKAKTYMQPFFVLNDSVAKRAMVNLLRDPEHQFSKNPEDYSLYHIGEYDDAAAAIYVPQEIQCIARCHELMPPKE